MSYLIYINDQLIESPSINFARTLQVNDIGNITNRNSNFSQSIKLPRTAKNKRIFDNVYNVGNQSNVPYQKATCDVIDADTGLHLVYKGWAVLLESNDKEYSITIYDGVIDFYKSIDNLTLTECNVSELNHIKNLTNVLDSWTNDLPYRYILADYNGNSLTPTGAVNIDFQVPSAKVSYLWNKIFEYIGYNFEGTIFGHEYFQNLWMSYPKPNSQETPELNLITEQESSVVISNFLYPDGNGGTFFGSSSTIYGLPNNGYSSIHYSPTTGALINGLFRFSFTPAVFTVNNGVTITQNSSIVIQVFNTALQTFVNYDVNIAGGNYIDINLNINDKIIVYAFSQGISNPNATVIVTQDNVFTTSFNYISGFSLGFDEAFIDFKVSDFVREIVTRFGLTLFKDKFSNTIKFLTTSELLQGTNQIDLSDKFIDKISEKYTFGSYAKRNTFKYKYNDDEQNQNNGYISINNQNLNEEVTLLNSLIYSPERLQSNFLNGSNVYKIWDKEIKDDETVEYKGLDGRFYFLRAENSIAPIAVGSIILGLEQTVNSYYRENYNRLNFQNIIQDFYAPIESIFDKAKLITCEFWFKKKDIANFDFSKLYFIEQLSSYYLVNKINNFVDGRPTKCELIEVDYMTEIPIINPPTPSYDIFVGTPTLDTCTITLPITTNYPLPTDVTVNIYTGNFDVFNGVTFTQMNLTPQITATLSGGSVSFDISQLPYNFYGYKFGITIQTANPYISFQSNISDALVLSGSCFVAPTFPSTLTLIRVTNLGLDLTAFIPNSFRYQLDYEHTGIPNGTEYNLAVEAFTSFLPNPPEWTQIGTFSKFAGSGTDLTVTMSVANVSKFRVKVNAITSNEVNV